MIPPPGTNSRLLGLTAPPLQARREPSPAQKRESKQEEEEEERRRKRRERRRRREEEEKEKREEKREEQKAPETVQRSETRESVGQVNNGPRFGPWGGGWS